MIRKILAMLIAMVLMAGLTFAQTVPEVSYEWDAPTLGSEAVKYVVEYRVNGGEWFQYAITDKNVITFIDEFDYLGVYEVRVAGIDILDRQGIFSIPSIPYMPDLGAPGAPGTPLIIQL